MIYINIGDLQIPDELKQKLNTASAHLEALSDEDRSAFIKKKTSAQLWGSTKPYLALPLSKDNNPQDFKCWYCEAKDVRADYHVDHFRPKNRVKNKGTPEEPGYWWLTFKYTNYRLACSYCNSPHTGEDKETRGKWDQFPLEDGSPRASHPGDNLDDEIPLLLDPTKAGDPGLLAFGQDGRAYPRYDNGFPFRKADRSLDVLNLNDVRIEEARKQLRLRCLDLVEQGNEEFLKFRDKGSAAALKSFDDVCKQIIEMVKCYSEFSAMARYTFIGTGQDWVLALLRTI